MRIIDPEECQLAVSWQDAHKIEMDEARAFIDSKAQMAELEINPNFAMSTQRTNYQHAFEIIARHYARLHYKISMRKGKVIVRRREYQKDGEKEWK